MVYALPNELRRTLGRLFDCCGQLLTTSVVFRISPGGMRRKSLGRDPELASHVLFSRIGVVVAFVISIAFCVR